MKRNQIALETILQSVQFGMMIVGEDRRIRMVNQAALRMMGFKSEEEIVGKVCHQRVCPAEEGKCPILDLHQKVDFSEKTLLCQGGTSLPILKSVSVINIEGETALLETFIDITERKKAEKEISEARAFIHAVMESVAEPIMVIGLDYRVKMMNMAAREFSHGGSGNARVQMCYQVSHHRDTPCSTVSGHPCPLEQVKRTGQAVMAVHEHIMADGSAHFYEILASPLRDSSGALEAIIETSRDITDRIRVERQRSDFLAMVTHDLKSPLTVIIGYAEMMIDRKKEVLDAETAEMLEGIYQSGKKLYGMVEDFLAISRLEKGETSLNLTITDVEQLLKEASDEGRVMASGSGVGFDVEVGRIPKSLFDMHLLRRALWNILENAVKFTPAGGRVSLKAETVQIEGCDFLVISVSDTGIGISPQEKEKIFDKYYRSPKATGIKGTGLGLAIVKAVAEAHSGKVELESEPWKGSTFRLVLPLNTVSPVAP